MSGLALPSIQMAKITNNVDLACTLPPTSACLPPAQYEAWASDQCGVLLARYASYTRAPSLGANTLHEGQLIIECVHAPNLNSQPTSTAATASPATASPCLATPAFHGAARSLPPVFAPKMRLREHHVKKLNNLQHGATIITCCRKYLLELSV